MSFDEKCNGSFWTREQDKAFENALATFYGDPDDRWEKIAVGVTGKTREEIKHHCQLLVEDVNAIESGHVPLPAYVSLFWDSTNHAKDVSECEKGSQEQNRSDSDVRNSSRSNQERRKGVAWTEDEHRLFLLGLEKYGKGDWKSISRNFVLSRTPTQVASHAQKYFMRLNSENKGRRRPSIHDITSIDDGDASVLAPQGTISGKMNGPIMARSTIRTGKSPPTSAPGVGMYAPPIDIPFQRPLNSIVGAPINLPSPVQMVYGVEALTPGSLLGAPTNMAPMTLLIPRSSDLK